MSPTDTVYSIRFERGNGWSVEYEFRGDRVTEVSRKGLRVLSAKTGTLDQLEADLAREVGTCRGESRPGSR